MNSLYYRKNTAGLTLIEVMLAMAILGIGLSVLVTAAGRSLAVVRKARNYEKARRYLAQVELTNPIFPDTIEPGSDSGSFDYPDQDWTWRRSIELISEEEEEGLYMITTRVSWSERGAQNHEEVVTYFHAPEELEGGTVESR
jgi:prepilin-type N-terminal cleavage/methylation domain-containing protein